MKRSKSYDDPGAFRLRPIPQPEASHMTNEQRCKSENAAFVAAKERENAERKRAQNAPGRAETENRCPTAESTSEGKEGRSLAEIEASIIGMARQPQRLDEGPPTVTVSGVIWRTLINERDTLKSALSSIEKFLPIHDQFVAFQGPRKIQVPGFGNPSPFQNACNDVRKALFGVNKL